MRPALLLLNFMLMVSLPLLLGWFIARRRRISWRFFGIGAVTFVLAQILHIPFNYLVANNLLSDVTDSSEDQKLLLTAAFLGLSAGVFEEGARYLAYRFWAKDARTWGKGLMMGAGHGGAESILLGLLGALNISILYGYRLGYFQGLIPTEQAPLVDATLGQLVAVPWFQLLFGALERVFVLCIQLALSLMVMQVFIRARLRWLLLAVGWHALVDTAVVLAVSTKGIYLAELVTGLAALISLLIIYKLREPEPEPRTPEPLQEPGPAQPMHIKPSREKLEESRYF